MNYTIKHIEYLGAGWKDFQLMPGFSGDVETNIDAPYFKIGLIVIDSYNKTLGRLACFINPFHIINSHQCLTIGYFEMIEDVSVFNLFMAEVIKIAEENDCKYLLGPINGSTWNDYRFNMDSETPAFLLEPVNPQFYPRLFKDYGFFTHAKYISQKTEQLTDNFHKAKKYYQGFLDAGIQFDDFNKDKPSEEFALLHELCSLAFKDNLLFSPISKDEFIQKMEPTIPLIKKKLTILARHQGKIVGFAFCYPDAIYNNEKTLIVKTLARYPSDKYRGMGSILTSLIMRNAIEMGFKKVIHALMLDSNISRNISNNYHGKVFRIYELLTYKL